MSKLSKICLFFAIFLASGSFAWAGFNYDSINNYFLLDSIFKTGGDYMVVDDALSGSCSDINYITQAQCESAGASWEEELIDQSGSNTGEFFSISNNLILPATGKFSSGIRQMSRNEFSTNAITLEVGNNFIIDSRGGDNILRLKADLLMNRRFIIDGGISLVNDFDPADNEIKARKLITNSINVLGSDRLIISDQTILRLTAGGSATASSLTWGGSVNNEGEVTVDNNYCHAKLIADSSYNNADKSGVTCQNGNCDSTGVATTCNTGYLVYDIDLDNKKIICCKAP